VRGVWHSTSKMLMAAFASTRLFSSRLPFNVSQIMFVNQFRKPLLERGVGSEPASAKAFLERQPYMSPMQSQMTCELHFLDETICH